VDNQRTVIIWGIAAAVGTVAVFWLRSYLNGLSELALTDRGAALELFRTRGLPALLLVVAIAVASGAMLMRQGLRIVNTARDAAPARDRSRGRPAAVTIGWLMASAGFALAAVPLALAAAVLWLLRRA
jgi:hypothetical protein